MVIVTGLRSGTSLIMRTLKLLGFPIIGYLFHDEFSHKELNPNGYYSLPMREIIHGLKTYYKGKAVKLGGALLYQTSPVFIKKIIVCERDKSQTINSIVKLLRADYNIAKIEPTIENAEFVYNLNIEFQEKAIKEFKKPFIRINFEDMIMNPKITIEKIKAFLELESNINDAILNVNKREALCLLHQ